MIKATFKSSIKFPEINLENELMQIAQYIVIPTMQANIEKSMGIDESPLPKNEPATIKRKNKATGKRIFTQKGDIRAGVPQLVEKTGLTSFGSARPLIDTGKLRASFIAKKAGKNKVIITLKGDRKKIGEYLQLDGVQTKKGPKFYRFFGISEPMRSAAIDFIKEKIAALCRG